MSKIKFAPNGIGSGEFTIAAPGTSTNRTINLPDLAGTLVLSDASGNVGIGTTSPSYRLDVASADTTAGTGYAVRIRANATAAAGAIQFTDSSATTQNGIIAVDTSSNMKFTTSLTERMRIDASGNVGVGTTAGAAYRLHTYGSNHGIAIQTSVANGGAGGGWVDFLAVNGTVQGNIYFNQAAGYMGFGTAASGSAQAERMRISATGAITFSNLYGVTVTTPRNVFVDASGNIGGISSIRASKTNIASISDANWVLDLNPVTFNYRKKDEDGNFTEDFDLEKMYGLIAEDAAEVNPDICIYNEVDGEQKLASIHYDRLIAPIIQVLKDQQEMIKTLQAQVAELQGV
jgi:hypothetical protein